jgi:hypothetical protein
MDVRIAESTEDAPCLAADAIERTSRTRHLRLHERRNNLGCDVDRDSAASPPDNQRRTNLPAEGTRPRRLECFPKEDVYGISGRDRPGP